MSTANPRPENPSAAEDINGLLFPEDAGPRAVLDEPPGSPSTDAVVAWTRQTVRISGGPGSGPICVNTPDIQVAQDLVASVRVDVDTVGTTLFPALAELGAWSVTGQPHVLEATATAVQVHAALVRRATALDLTAGHLLRTRWNYESAEDIATGLFPSGGLVRSYPSRTAQELIADTDSAITELRQALDRAGVDSVEEFRAAVRLTVFGLEVKGGGPDGTNAMIRGVGPDDLLDAVLTAPVPAVLGRSAASEAAVVTGADRNGSRTGPYTLGRYLRDRVTTVLTRYGVEDAHPLERRYDRVLQVVGSMSLGVATGTAGGIGPSAGLVPVTVLQTASPTLGALAPAVTAPGPARTRGAARTAAHLMRGVVRGLDATLAARSIGPAAQETFTGVTPANAKDLHMTRYEQRALVRGVEYEGTVPVTVAQTAAAVKDAKNIVSGTAADGSEVENSTVKVTKAMGPDGRTAYSLEFTGTEKWHNSTGVNDLKGIADSMAGAPNDSFEDLAQAQRMALCALQDAGIRPGDKVMLSGHSLGGIYVGGLAANREFQRLYSVETATTFGAPIEGFRIPATTSVMSVVHRDDLVPALDGAPRRVGETWATVEVGTPYDDSDLGAGERVARLKAHDMHVYTVGGAAVTDTQAPAVLAHEARMRAATPQGENIRSLTYVYEGREVRTSPREGRLH